jgi:molybdopterin-containing oxidoreductase family iron-sulfur binding subunit
MRGQAALQGVYNPDRIKTPLMKEKDGWRALTFPQAEALLAEKAAQAAQKGPNRVRMLTEVEGDSLSGLFEKALERWNSKGPLVFEPFAYESLKTANQKIFGIEGLPTVHMEQADFLVSLGADFLETWLSPVEYAWKFKAMHALKDGQKGLFFHIGPYQTMTGANADQWLSCQPGSETTIVLGLIREALLSGKGRKLPQSLRTSIEKITAPYTPEKVVELTGVAPDLYKRLQESLLNSQKPLILGTGTGSMGKNSLQTNMAVNLLNLILDPDLSLFDFENRHRVENAAPRSDVLDFFQALKTDPVELLLLNNTNPVYAFSPTSEIEKTLVNENLFVVSFSNFMDETTALADLILPVQLPVERWGEYSGRRNLVSTLQPATGRLTGAPNLGDLFLRAAYGEDRAAESYKAHIFSRLLDKGVITGEIDWVQRLQNGGSFESATAVQTQKGFDIDQIPTDQLTNAIGSITPPQKADLVFIAAPSIRFFDGRGANKSWLCEIPDPLTRVAWQTPVLMHPQTLKERGLAQEDIIRIQTNEGSLEAPVYETVDVRPGVMVMGSGQGHAAYGRYAQGVGLNPFSILPFQPQSDSGGPVFAVNEVSISKTAGRMQLANTDGSRIQHDRTFALAIPLEELKKEKAPKKYDLTMENFPLTLPLPEGYDPERDFYPPHDHLDYRWGMVVDLDKCIGCGACAVACYAENNVGIVKVEQVLEGREMAWLNIQRFLNPSQMEKVTFLPMLCQHCDNAPCESVCPVYAPHHSKEGLNNQIYNRCIGTRFCSQNCPYKVRRFNWYDWEWPQPTNVQLNPDVTARSKGVMEKCSFCIQRIKTARSIALNEKRLIRDGEVIPACVQTCPTHALVFGSLMDPKSRVRKMVEDPRAYQILGYLNTKPAVIYLKKVVHSV